MSTLLQRLQTLHLNGLTSNPHAVFYEIGSVIAYETFCGSLRQVVVTAKVENIKNGKDGFDGYILGEPENTVWGYDYQIIRVYAQKESK